MKLKNRLSLFIGDHEAALWALSALLFAFASALGGYGMFLSHRANAQSQPTLPITIPISNPLLPSDVTWGMSLTPLDASGAPIAAMTLGWPASPSLQSSTSFTFPPQNSAYVVSGFELLVTPRGTGFTTRQPGLIDSSIGGQLQVPSGIALLATVNAPALGLGSVVVALGPDTVPPSFPTITSITPGQTSAIITWSAATDNIGVTSYALERAPGTTGTFAQIAQGSALTFADSGLTLATVYSYRVRAADAAGNFGPYSNVASVTTLSPPPPPPPPSTFSAPGSCTAPAAVTGCSVPLPALIDSNGTAWTLVKGVPFKQPAGAASAVATNNPYSPGITYLYVNPGNPNTIRSHNANGTYWCVNPATSLWQASGC
jgi:chitodextrinase